jgi:hypothetical protein
MQKIGGPDDSWLAPCLEALAIVYQNTGRPEEMEAAQLRASSIRAKNK